MTTALVVDGAAAAGSLAADLAAAGIRVLAQTSPEHLLRDAIQHRPDVVVCREDSPDESLFDALGRLAEAAPCATALFSQDPEAAKIERALAAGVTAYIVNGYAPERLRAVLQVARARFANEHKLRLALADVTRRFDERKLVDRAKGILMRARQVGEDEAFAVLRAASMHSNRRVGQVSKQVIAAAHYADAVNRSGKLRMLSQRLVKLAALAVFDSAQASHAVGVRETLAQIEASVAALARSLSKPTFGDLLEAVSAAGVALATLAAAPPAADRLGALDDAAEAMLTQAERLTRQLETAGLVTTLHVINLSGRQRMLAQRHAKQALLGLRPGLTAGSDATSAATAATFSEAMTRLKSMPLSTPEIRDLLLQADAAWSETVRAGQRIAPGASARALGDASERVVALFDELTDRYERSMQVLMG